LIPTLRDLMLDATRLTQRGELKAATRAIQAALALTPIEEDGDVIDVVARTVQEPVHEPVHEPVARPDAPAPGSFSGGTHSCAAGQRDFKLYVPPQAGERPLPLVVMLHGCTQDPDDFAAGTAMNEVARQQGFYVLYAAQSPQANPQRCWSWFKHTHQERDRGEPAILASMTQTIIGSHPIDPTRVYVAGLSAGGAMAAILGQTHPDLFAAVGVHSGLGAGAAADLPSALAAMKGGASGLADSPGSPPTIIFHGDADTTVHPSNATALEEALVGGSIGSATEIKRPGQRPATRHAHHLPDGRTRFEYWQIHGAGHAWSGGTEKGSYTDPRGPDASTEMVRFFLQHRVGSRP
jgi:poly(hydroxyalkanoate) depolymerase family esterase